MPTSNEIVTTTGEIVDGVAGYGSGHLIATNPLRYLSWHKAEIHAMPEILAVTRIAEGMEGLAGGVGGHPRTGGLFDALVET